MIICKKTFSEVPIAHRQHLHDGHCAKVHGHNWDIIVTFACDSLDENGFVVDFGKLGYLKDWIKENLDHACMFNKQDALAQKLINACPNAWKVFWLEACSCEGLANELFIIFNQMVKNTTNNRARVSALEVKEDSKNTAICLE